MIIWSFVTVIFWTIVVAAILWILCARAGKLINKKYSMNVVLHFVCFVIEYIKKLKTVFANNSFINIKFDEIEVYKYEEKGNIYGITLRQHWNSLSYSDEGWLFLMIDFRNENAPQIRVRTWQPLEAPRNKVFSLIDFHNDEYSFNL